MQRQREKTFARNPKDMRRTVVDLNSESKLEIKSRRIASCEVNHIAIYPPSTIIAVPVTHDDSSLAR